MSAGNYNSSNTALSGVNAPVLPDGVTSGDYWINSGAKVTTAQMDIASSTTLTAIPGLSVNVLAGATYKFRAHLMGVSTTNGGLKCAINGTATATTVAYTGTHTNGTTTNAKSTTTTLGNAVGASTTVVKDFYIDGAITVATAGTLAVYAAQNASHSDTTSIYVMSDFEITRVA